MSVPFDEARRQIIEFLNDPTHTPDGHLAQIMPELFSLVMACNYVYDHRGSNLICSEEKTEAQKNKDALDRLMENRNDILKMIGDLKDKQDSLESSVVAMFERADEALSGE